MGPVISTDDRDRVLSWIDEASAAGARGAHRRRRSTASCCGPTVVADAPADAKVSCEEVFGPLCTVTAYDTLDEAIELANGTRYGLQAGIFTRDLQTAFRAARELEFGGVTVNEAPTFRADQMPYGGVKDSGTRAKGPRTPCAR